MNQVQQFVAFATAARNGSFAKAARELAQTPSTIAKSISRLESQLGVRLFHRTTRQVSLTPDGQQLFEQCQRILEEVETLRSYAAGARGDLRGTLKIEASMTWGKRVLLPVLAKLLERHPGLSIDARLSDQLCDVIREGLDATIRIGPLADSRLVARLVGHQNLLVCASRGYLAKHGAPASPEDLERHHCVTFRVPSSGRGRPWQFRVDGENVERHPPSRLRLGDGEAMVEAAAAGLGLAQAPDYMMFDALSSGRVVEVLSKYRPAPLAINVLYPSSRMVPPRVRALIDALTEPGALKLRIRLA